MRRPTGPFTALYTQTLPQRSTAPARGARTQGTRGGGTRGQQQQWLCVSFEQLQHTVHCAAAAEAFRAVGVLTD